MSTSEAEAGSSDLLTRVQNLIVENKKAVIIGTAAAVVALGGAAYYASSSRTVHKEEVDSEKGEERTDKKKSVNGEKRKDKKGKKKKTVKDKDGPLLEERKPKAGGLKTTGKLLGIPVMMRESGSDHT